MAWLYAPGDRESHLLARMRREAFRDCCEIFHPGLFRRPSALVLFRQARSGRRRAVRLRVAWSGELQLRIAGTVVLSGWRDQAEAVLLDTVLPAGDCEIRATVCREDAPPALAVSGGGLAAAWECSVDMVAWTPAATAPVGPGYPHAWTLPVRAVALRRRRDGLWSAGRLHCGSVEVEVSGRGNLAVRPGESIAEAMSDASPEQPTLCALVKGRGRVTGRAMALRHVRITAGAGVQVRAVRVQAADRQLPLAGAFACSDPALERIWQACANTVRLCSRELFVDGIKRDRLPWAGDLWVGVRAEAATFGDGRAARDTLVALAPPDARRRHVNTIIDYTPLWLLAIAAWRQRFAEDGLARELEPAIRSALDGLAAACDGEGFLRQRPGDWLFIDWGDINKRDISTPLQCLWLAALRAGAALLPDGHCWTERADALAARIDARLWDARAGRYADGRVDGRLLPAGGRHANLMPLVCGLARGARRRGAARVLADPAVPGVGTPYMRWVEAMARVAAGDAAGAVAGVRSYWSGMLGLGGDATWEACDPAQTGDARWAFYGRPFAKSLCHVWGAGPAALFAEELPGLQPIGLGWSALRWRPRRLPLAWMRVTVPTPSGPLVAEQEAGHWRLRVPEGIAVDAPTGARRRRGGLWEVAPA